MPHNDNQTVQLVDDDKVLVKSPKTFSWSSDTYSRFCSRQCHIARSNILDQLGCTVTAFSFLTIIYLPARHIT
jgi:hypothetical protein